MAPQQFPVAIDKKYKFLRELGAGAYGIVSALRNLETGEEVACKKLIKVFDKPILARRALREIKLLRHLNGHENITNIIDIELPDSSNFNEVFLIEGLMEADLHQIIRSGQPLTDAHYQYFLYQICRGMKWIHTANILHRDLKPGNLLVNADCELRVCDFGLARGFSQTLESNAGFMTEYVTTRWYRAPEIMLSFQCYTKAIDVWSVGCIFAELLGGKPLFKGQTYVDQLNQIMGILGTPDDTLLRRIGSEKALSYIRSLPRMSKVPFSKLYPKATPAALDLLEKMLKWDPLERITIEKALEHPYLASYHDKEDEPACPTHFDFGFESVKTLDDIRKMIVAEVVDFKRCLAAKSAKNDRGPLSARLPHPQGVMPTKEEKDSVVRDDKDEEIGAGIEDELRGMQLAAEHQKAKKVQPPMARDSSRTYMQ